MNRKQIVAIVLCLLAFGAGEASACHRCGLFGRRCRFAVHHVAPVAYVPPATQSNFIFNNSFPTPYLLAPGAQSVYGYSLASAAYTLDPSLYLDRAARLAEQSNENARLGIEGFTSSTSLALQLNDAADRRHKNAVLALSAMEANTAAAGPVGFRATVANGQLSIERLDLSAASQAVTADSCGKCHDGTGTSGAPKDLVLTGAVPLSFPQLEAAIEAVVSGKMPPKSNLSAAQKAATAVSLAKLLAVADDGGLK